MTRSTTMAMSTKRHELTVIWVEPTHTGFQATGRDERGEYVASAFDAVDEKAIDAVKKEAHRRGFVTDGQIAIKREPMRHPPKVGPDRFN